VHIVDHDRRSTGAQGRDRDVAEPNGLFDQSAGTVVFTEEVAGVVVVVEDCAGGAAGDFDPLAEGRCRSRFR
jgi:hypothetical protein